MHIIVIFLKQTLSIFGNMKKKKNEQFQLIEPAEVQPHHTHSR